MINLPSLAFGMLLSTLYGTAFHLWRGGNLGRLVFYIFLGWAGFWGGHFLAAWQGWNFAEMGQLRIGTATLGSWMCIGLGYWLSLIDISRSD